LPPYSHPFSVEPHGRNDAKKSLRRVKKQVSSGEPRTFKGNRCWWLMPIILATQEAENRRIAI
jgi:hypothetical protein